MSWFEMSCAPLRAIVSALTSSLVCAVLVFPLFAHAVDTAVLRAQPAPENIVVGFVGGFVKHDNPHHGPVKLAQQIRTSAPPGTYVQVFENRRRRLACLTILRLLDANHDGVLSAQEKEHAHIILFGQSWGAAAAVELARDLRREHVPVLLTVQVDSVAKLWQNDSVIPDNVAEAINFYQTEGVVHGRRHVVAANPSKTEILGNFLMDYKKNPVQCSQYPFWDRVFTPGHMQSECDPNLWLQIGSLVKQRLSPGANSAALSSGLSFNATQ
jgi:hypothetical protein